MTNLPDVAAAVAAADAALMRRALVVAERALGSRDVPIGAVVVAGDGGAGSDRCDLADPAAMLGAGCNAREASGDPTAHAEILALREAATAAGSWNLSGTTLVVTCEPCTMCAGAAVMARVSRVVFGCFEPKTGAAGSLWDVLRDPRLTHRVQVRGGVLEDECGALLREFFSGRR